MKPIVLVGGGEYHYRLIQMMGRAEPINRPVIVVSAQRKILPRLAVAPLLSGKLPLKEGVLDLWLLCQRTGIYFLNDDCININYEDQVIHLAKYGRLEYHRLSVETYCRPGGYQGLGAQDASVMQYQSHAELIEKMSDFYQEVHRHCPRDIRVIINGIDQFSLEFAQVVSHELQKSCKEVDVVLMDDELFKRTPEGPFTKKQLKNLKDSKIRVLSETDIQSLGQHRVEFVDGKTLEFDVLVPMNHWQSRDFAGRLLQSSHNKIQVNEELLLGKARNVFALGDNVELSPSRLPLSEISANDCVESVLHNISADGQDLQSVKVPRKSFLTTGALPLLQPTGFFQNYEQTTQLEEWHEKRQVEIKQLRTMPLVEKCQKDVEESLLYEAQHMSRPWKGLLELPEKMGAGQYRLTSFNGFNSWGTYTLSANKICEIAILKTMARGIEPTHLRFNLTLPGEQSHLTQHIFESTFKAIEEVADRHNVEIDGGDTFDGKHWHLNITIGGEVSFEIENRFQPHDYLIMTRPLGFGFLWAGRLSENYDSNWFERTMDSSILAPSKKFFNFVKQLSPSALVLIEEWGFLYHCLQSLPAHQQLLVNFREVPRWQGVDQIVASSVKLPGLETNWERIKEDVAFSKEEVSKSNAVLWDSMSQGALVIGVKATQYKEALCHLRDMGYKDSSLVGCIRPKLNRNKVVLSDWTP